MDIHEILKHLPHRYPFLLVDRVVDFEPGKFLHAYKNITINEPFFVGHFPHHPVLPGVLIMEALAQAAGILSFKTMGSLPDENSVFYFVGIDNARFKPGHRRRSVRTCTSRSCARCIGITNKEPRQGIDGEIVASPS